jgi:hypothetical protein
MNTVLVKLKNWSLIPEMVKSKLPENWKPAEVNCQAHELENIYEANQLLVDFDYYCQLDEFYLLYQYLYKGVSNQPSRPKTKLPSDWRSVLHP